MDIELPDADTLYRRFCVWVAQQDDAALADRAQVLVPDNLVCSDGDLAVCYTPSEYLNPLARIAILGITPGWQQTRAFLRQSKADIAAGLAADQVRQRARAQAQFAGSMRRDLIVMLDQLGLPEHLGIDSAASLFGERADLLHTGSLLRYPVFVDGRNYSGHTPRPSRHPLLRAMLEQWLSPSLAELPEALILPLGKAAEDGLDHLIAQGALSAERVCRGLPHPSGVNAGRWRQFDARKEALTARLAAYFEADTGR